MAYLSLKGIGKIYVGEGAVAVGIRGVDLDMELGEFVAVTGRSGSGKSTLLNVISGMDSYEEGELYVEGEPTSHFRQTEWERYREKYISFIFQDYNIIDSFTVLQNVELALMHIEDGRERRRRALELIGRVGLEGCLHRRGSKLSGGQKQRTVIARALAKDSPIILADEPCGNLDSATSEEIVRLLHDVCRDKLLIMVTHNIDTVAGYATREVRIFDGAVASDTPMTAEKRETAPMPSEDEKSCEGGERAEKKGGMGQKEGISEPAPTPAPRGFKYLMGRLFSVLKRGTVLGCAIFTSRPKLTAFICMLTVIASVGASVTVSSTSSAVADMLTRPTLFTHVEGRLVVASRDGGGIDGAKLAALAESTGATDVLRYDALLDHGGKDGLYQELMGNYFGSSNSFGLITKGEIRYQDVGFRYGNMPKSYSGRLPERRGEVLLNLPISYLADYSEEELLSSYGVMGLMPLTVVGVAFYADNNITPTVHMTKEGFESLSLISRLPEWGNRLEVTGGMGLVNHVTDEIGVCPDAEGIFINNKTLMDMEDKEGIDLKIAFSYEVINNGFTSLSYIYVFDKSEVVESLAEHPIYESSYHINSPWVIIGERTLERIIAEGYGRTTTQASLIYGSDADAERAVEAVKEAGYSAVPSGYKYRPDAVSTLIAIISGVLMAVMLVLTVVFLSFFVYICSARALSATSHEVAIMRSMGIPAAVIRVGMYVRMALCFIPGALSVLLIALMICYVPAVNAVFGYMYFWQYLIVLAVIFSISARVTATQMRRLFEKSVKATLRGGQTV